MRTLEERYGGRRKRDSESQSPSWSRNGYHLNLNGSQIHLKIFEVFVTVGHAYLDRI